MRNSNQQDQEQQNRFSFPASEHFNKNFRILQENLISLYLQLFLFYCITLFVISHFYWDISLSVAIIFMSTFKLLNSYLNCKSCTELNNVYFAIDQLIQSMFLLHLLIYINIGGSYIYASSIAFFIFQFIFQFIHARNFLNNQVFKKNYFLLNLFLWISQAYLSMTFIFLCGCLEGIQQHKWNQIQILVQIYFYFLIILISSIFLSFLKQREQNEIEDKKQKNFRIIYIVYAKFYIIIGFVGITISIFCIDLIIQISLKNQENRLFRAAKFSFYFCIVYSIIQLLISSLGYKQISNFFAFDYQNDRVNERNRSSQIVPQETINQQIKTIQQVNVEGIIQVTIRKISSTLFKIEKKQEEKKQEEKKDQQQEQEENRQQEEMKIQVKQDQDNQTQTCRIETENDELQNQLEKNKSQERDRQSMNSEIIKCIVCCENDPNSIFYPCSHGGLCYECASLIMQKNKTCSLCRTPIHQILKYSNQNEEREQYRLITISRMKKVKRNELDNI